MSKVPIEIAIVRGNDIEVRAASSSQEVVL